MTIVGVDGSGTTSFRINLDHGADPAVLAHDRGFVVVRPLDAVRDETGDLVLRMLVRPVGDEPRPPAKGRGRDRTLLPTDDLAPMVRQRVAAYAVVLSARGLLATQFSALTAVAGRWGMPGGGLDDYEQPAAAVLREVSRRPPSRSFWETWLECTPRTGLVAIRRERSRTFMPSGWCIAAAVSRLPTRSSWTPMAPLGRPAGCRWTHGRRCAGRPTRVRCFPSCSPRTGLPDPGDEPRTRMRIRAQCGNGERQCGRRSTARRSIASGCRSTGPGGSALPRADRRPGRAVRRREPGSLRHP